VKEIDFQHKLDKKIKDLYKKMKAKKLRDEEKARKVADKAARKAATDAKRVANRRAKRIREREEAAAAAAEAGEDNTGGLDEEVGLLFVRVLHSDTTNFNSFATNGKNRSIRKEQKGFFGPSKMGRKVF
jgi:hypothetical protein